MTAPRSRIRTPRPANAATRTAPTRELPLPHERDTSLDAVDDARTSPLIEQAGRDLQAGMVDTDLRATPGLDAERRDRLVPGAERLPRRRP